MWLFCWILVESWHFLVCFKCNSCCLSFLIFISLGNLSIYIGSYRTPILSSRIPKHFQEIPSWWTFGEDFQGINLVGSSNPGSLLEWFLWQAWTERNLKMADDAKVERDTSRTLLILVFRRLCWVGKENRIVKTLREVQQLYDESVEKNIILCGMRIANEPPELVVLAGQC